MLYPHMEYALLLAPLFLTCAALGVALGVLSFFVGTAPWALVALLGSAHLIPCCLGLLLLFVILGFFTPLRKNIDSTEVFRLGLFFFLGAALAFYFTFRFYFRFSSLFLMVSGVAWLLALPFYPRSIPNRQFTFVPFFSNVFQGLGAGLIVGGLGFAGLPLLIPFLQVFRKMDRPGAVSTALPLGGLAILAMMAVLYTPAADIGPIFVDASYGPNYYLLVGGGLFVGLMVGINFGKKLQISMSPLVVSFIQLFFILGTVGGGYWQVKKVLPCFGKNPLSCLKCFQGDSPISNWKNQEMEPNLDVVVNSCGQPLGIHQFSERRSDLIVSLPDINQSMRINRETGAYSDSWEGSRIKRVRKQRVYFDKVGCVGGAALSRRKLETQVGVTAIVNDGLYRDITEARSAFWYISYRDAEGECVNQSGVIKSSSETGVYILSAGYNDGRRGAPMLDEDGCHKFLDKGTYTSSLYYADEECKSESIATDTDGSTGEGKSILFHQEKYYLIKNKMPFFEYHSYQVSGKECIKKDGLLSPSSEWEAYSVQEVERPFDFSQKLPLSVRKLPSRDLRFW